MPIANFCAASEAVGYSTPGPAGRLKTFGMTAMLDRERMEFSFLSRE